MVILGALVENIPLEGLAANPYVKAIVRNVMFAAGFYITTRGYVFTRMAYYTLGRDLKALTRLLRTKYYMNKFRKQELSVAKAFKQMVKKHPNKVAFYFEDEEWTFKELDIFSNKVANLILDSGISAGDEVSLFMESKPEYVGIWLGLAKIGVISALINTNQKQDTLIHSISTVNSKALIYGSELQKSVNDVFLTLHQKLNLQFFCFGAHKMNTSPLIKDMKKLVRESSDKEPSQIANGKFSDHLFYIFTSGTTGLPKAVIIKNSRYLFMSTVVKMMLGVRDDDVLYTCIPLYHMAGGAIGTGNCLVHGTSMAIRHKFSASKFWSDCIKYNCTVAQYVGELCRYLLAQPPNKLERKHKVRLMFGNGLRPAIWKEFQTRFNVKTIGEFYGSSEGNANVVNVDNKEGSCGFISQLLPGPLTDLFYPVCLIKVDESGEPTRDANGLCIRCQGNECGEFIGKIVSEDPLRAFDGYVNKEATKKKIICDVFKKGDAYFSSGDLLFIDEFGYAYFKDRTGDTFRWKGENVSTTEIEEIVGKILKHGDCIAFGVEIPSCEGRAGMIVIATGNLEQTISLSDLLNDMQQRLPNYAIPIFIRLTESIEVTGTLKLPKVNFQREAFNPTLTTDPIYVLDVNKNGYIRLDEKFYEDIINGQIRF